MIHCLKKGGREKEREKRNIYRERETERNIKNERKMIERKKNERRETRKDQILKKVENVYKERKIKKANIKIGKKKQILN